MRKNRMFVEDPPVPVPDPMEAEPLIVSEDGALVVGEKEAGERLDRFLALRLPEHSRTRLKSLIIDGHVQLGDVTITDPGMKLSAGSLIAIELPEAVPAEPAGEPIPLVVVYEDDDLLVIDKPAGLVVHPASGHATGTLVNALIAHCGDSLSGIGGVKRPGIVHRLDKDTSGLLVVAKNDAAHKHLADQFADHGRTGPLQRAYSALVWGVPSRPHGVIDAPIDRSITHRDRMAVVKPGKGREALTHFTVEDQFLGRDGEPLIALVTCRLETGRTHQIRVHMAHIGHALVGDPVYGAGFRTKVARLDGEARGAVETFSRQALHARELGFMHPRSKETLHFESALPGDFGALLKSLSAN
ncbi:MAG: RluA family pseudouridine synthase [Beijerinckiaceae bacterium]|nr:RluA family pseudouridine synthase [Beijerinckiaceae bacterium]